MYQPKTGALCSCKPGVYRDNCGNCEGTGWVIDFQKVREYVKLRLQQKQQAQQGEKGV